MLRRCLLMLAAARCRLSLTRHRYAAVGYVRYIFSHERHARRHRAHAFDAASHDGFRRCHAATLRCFHVYAPRRC